MLDNIKKAKEELIKVKHFFKETYNKHIIYMYITVALLVNLIIEMLARGSFLKGIFYLISSPYVFICNSIIILMTLSVTLLMRRRFFGISIISIVWIIFGIANCVLLSYRVTPFTAVDMMLIDSALDVMNKYLNTFAYILIIALAILAVVGLVFVWIKVPKVNHKINYVRNIIAIAIIWVIGFGAINLGIASSLLSAKFGNLADSYRDYGFVYCFTNSLVNTGVDKPADYSDKTIKSLTADVEETKVKKKPNIIFLQLESFFDINNMTNITFSENPVPYFESLMEQYPSGYLDVPIVGAGTVNTEFEVMTGMNLDDFGPGEYPFKTILKETTCESIAYNLKEYGYATHAIHDNTATFYSRNVVFSNLGYDTFSSIETMNIDDFTPMGWAKDYFLTDEIVVALDSTEGQDYIYTISVQGHGSYPTEGDYDYPITVSGLDDQAKTNQYQYYVWQINEMDKFIQKLVETLSKRDEDTILVMYGDHLPSLGITESELENGDVYQTQYVIWSNFKTKYEDEDIEAYQLQSKILGGLNMTAGTINNYTQKHKNDDDYADGLQNLEYDSLYGDHLLYGGDNPYVATDIQFGLTKVSVSSISPMNDGSGTVYIYGKNFTNYSKVYINDEKVSTVFIDDSTLMINYGDLKDGDSFSVYQQNSDTHVLKKTDPIIFESENLAMPQEETTIPETTVPETKKNRKNKKNKE